LKKFPRFVSATFRVKYEIHESKTQVGPKYGGMVNDISESCKEQDKVNKLFEGLHKGYISKLFKNHARTVQTTCERKEAQGMGKPFPQLQNFKLTIAAHKHKRKRYGAVKIVPAFLT